MKFGKLFYSSFVPEWNKQYMSYKRFKKILKKYRKQLRGYSGYSCGAKKSFVQAMIEGDANSLTAPRKNSDPPTPISAERARELLLELYAEFFTAIQEELEKVNEFFCFKEKELQDQFAALNSESPLDDDSDSNHTQQLLVGDVESSTRKLAALQKQYGQIYVTLHLLVRKYSKLNYNACVKIMKKFDKVAKDNRKQAFLKENVETLPFYARADDLLRGLARQVENRYIKTGLLLLAINNGNNTGGVVDKESVAHAAEKEYSRLLAMLEDAQVSSHVGWEWRAFFPISKDDFILSDPTTTSSCSATSYSATGECCDEVAAAAAANKQRQQQQTVVADLWRHLNAPMTREQLCRVTEDRTDEYYIIPDCKYGLKLRNRNLLELKVRRDCHETELLSTATTTPVSSPSSSNNKSTSTKICVEKWEKALITALPAASEHHEQESDFEEKQVDKELHQIYDALRENTKFLRIAGLVQEELNDNNSNKDISNNNASSSSSSSSRIKKVLFRKLRVQNSELIKGLTLEQTDTHVAIITTTTTTTAQQQQQQQHDFYFRSICVEGAKRDQVAQFVSESIVTPSCPPSTADAPTTSSATTTTSAANVGPNNNNNNNNRNNDELGTAATNTLLQSPYNSVVLGGASDLVTVLGHHCCTPMGYPELVLSLVQRFNNSRH